MSEKILVPVLGESITEATVSKWLKKQGDSVIADEAVVELETDKVNLEVPASTHGVIAEINANEGDTVEVGAVLGVISETANKTENKPSNQVIEDQKDQVEENPKIFKTKVEPTLKTEEKDNVISLDVEKKQKLSSNQKISSQKSEIVKYEPKSSFSFGKLLSYILVVIISFIALILILDTFKIQLYNIFPRSEVLLFNLYETLKDIQLFIKDLI